MGNSPLVVVHVALERILGLLSLQALLIIVSLLLAHLISALATQASHPPSWIRAFGRAARSTGAMCARQGVHADSSGPKDSAVLEGARRKEGAPIAVVEAASALAMLSPGSLAQPAELESACAQLSSVLHFAHNCEVCLSPSCKANLHKYCFLLTTGGCLWHCLPLPGEPYTCPDKGDIARRER